MINVSQLIYSAKAISIQYSPWLCRLNHCESCIFYSLHYPIKDLSVWQFQSHFLTSKEPKSTVIDSKDKAATTALNKSASHSNGLSKVNTSSSTNSSNNEQSKRKGAPLPTAGEESRKRPAGSSFAAKFGSLPHVEGKVNQPMKPQR